MKTNLKNNTKERFKTFTVDMSIFEEQTDDEIMKDIEESEKEISQWKTITVEEAYKRTQVLINKLYN